MVKQKIVIKISTVDPRNCSKALQIATKFIGVISASLEGDRIVVVSEGVDSVALTKALKKKMCFGELITVTPVEAKKEEKKVEAKKEEKKPTPVLTQFSVPLQIPVDPTKCCVVYYDDYPYYGRYPCHNPDPCRIL